MAQNNEILQSMLTIKDIMELMQMGRHQVEKLVKSPGFPCIKIGGSYRIPADEFNKWIKTYAYSDKPFILSD